MQKMSESDFELFRSGSETIFEKIVEAYYPPMRNFSSRFTNEANADIITIRAFAALCRCRKDLDSMDTLRSLLYKTIFDGLLTFKKRELTKPPFSDEEEIAFQNQFSREVIRFECLRMKLTYVKNLLTVRE
jgi:hypothetical protein